MSGIRTCWLALLSLGVSFLAEAQVGGKRALSFLELPATAKVAALGGVNISEPGGTAGAAGANPGLLHPQLAGQAAYAFTGYAGGIAHNTLSYVWAPPKRRVWGLGLTYLDYGNFTARDAAGQEEGKFAVYDLALSGTHAATIGPFTLGATVKMAVSALAEFKAIGLLADAGGLFRHPEKDLTIGLALKNLGYLLQPFAGESRTATPFDVQLGFTYKPEHMPFRFSLTAHRLTQPDIVYLDTAANRLQGRKLSKSLADQVARHLVLGVALPLGKNFSLRGGYNHLRRQELRQEQTSGVAGFSLGTLIRVKGFQLDYAHAFFHPAGGSHHITLSTDLSRFLKKEKNGEPGN